jgi:hypothetical protein
MVRDVADAAHQWQIVIDGIFQINQAFARIYSVGASIAINAKNDDWGNDAAVDGDTTGESSVPQRGNGPKNGQLPKRLVRRGLRCSVLGHSVFGWLRRARLQRCPAGIPRCLVISSVVSLVEFVIATLVGARLYKEREAASAVRAIAA